VADWNMIVNAGTSLGTLALAATTLASVRSANRAARVAERSLMAGLRPVLMPSRPNDRTEKVIWMDDQWTHLDGGKAYAELVGDRLYLAMSLRNVGSGLGILHGWAVFPGRLGADQPQTPLEDFHMQTRDLYIPAGDSGYWHAALRGADLDAEKELVACVTEHQMFTIDLLYGDHEGGQRTITRFGMVPRQGENTTWIVAAARHWNLDRDDPR
jgi:hypothetical protein